MRALSWTALRFFGVLGRVRRKEAEKLTDTQQCEELIDWLFEGDNKELLVAQDFDFELTMFAMICTDGDCAS
tara:strand:+ start:715 stop:930 length:216 start_codon:yes stop_codon:yes gene_type:complete